MNTAEAIAIRHRATLTSIREDPREFIEQVLGIKTWSTSRAICEAVARHRLVAIKGCHASSKTHTLASLIPWWLQRWEGDSSVIVTGPTFTQAKEGVWREMSLAMERSKILFPPPGESMWKISPHRFAMVRATSKAERGVRFQGVRTENMLIVVDEAPGVAAEIFEAIEGLRAGGNVHVVLLGNPTVPGGYFYDAHTSGRNRWHCITVDAMDTPNLRGVTMADLLAMPLDEGGPLDENEMPFLVTRRWVRDALENWGEQNPRFEARVRGVFPQQAEGALIPLAWIESASVREVERSNQRLSAGIDVAAGGENETVLYIVDRGHIIAPPIATRTPAEDGRCRSIIAAGLAPWKGEMGVVRYDSIGAGAYFGLHLRDMGYNVAGVDVGLASRRAKEFPRLRDELFWSLREEFRQGRIAGLKDETTIAQLTALRYTERPDGRIKVESKNEIRARGSKSPDRADALMLANFAVGDMHAAARVPLISAQASILERELRLG